MIVPIVVLTAVLMAGNVRGQEAVPEAPGTCYGAGSMTAAVLLTLLCSLLLAGALAYFWKRKNDANKERHLILETDPERGGKGEYAFDNPGFKDTTIIATSEKTSKAETSTKTKWGHWSPLAAALNLKPEKKRPLDDSALQNGEVKVVALKSQDFTGLGFNICGNMKEGIYIRDILHRGPAFESGKLNPGDRINSVTISFEHMVYEDALNILSYASPYEVIVEAKSGRLIAYQQGQGQLPIHPIFKSASSFDLSYIEKSSKKKLFNDDYSSSSNYSSLQKSRSNVTTLERKESKSPRPPNQPKSKKLDKSPHRNTPELEDKNQRLGVKALPRIEHQMSPKIVEQNQNNANIERRMVEEEELPIQSIDKVDVTKATMVPPQVKKREKKSPEPAFERNGSGIRRDENGIPLELPDHMQDAALAARRNRKSVLENGLSNTNEDRRTKSKAPSPPPASDLKVNFTLGGNKSRPFENLSTAGFGSDSEYDDDVTNMSSVNTIELNSSDITVHQQMEDEERKARKTASTGDLTKMKKAPRSNTGTLERAQSLDITDTSGSGLMKKTAYEATENLLIEREPRLSLILDGLNTFQRNQLKSSTEWGNLEDAILNFKRDEDEEQRRMSEPQFNAVVDKVLEIKRESAEMESIPGELIRQYQNNASELAKGPRVSNKLWPDEEDLSEIKFENSGWKRLGGPPEITKRSLEVEVRSVPVVPERTKLKVSEPPSSDSPKQLQQNNLETEVITKPPSLLNQPNANLSVEYECIKPMPAKRERIPENETVINLNNKIGTTSPVTSFEKHNISEMCSQIAKGRGTAMIKDEWEEAPAPSTMTLMDEVMDSYNKNYANTITVVQTEGIDTQPSNIPDESKIIDDIKHLTADFLLNEKAADTNVPDDVKVSRGSFESLELTKGKSDDAKNEDRLVSQPIVSENGASNLHSLELSINSDPPTVSKPDITNDVTVIVSRPNQITVKKIESNPGENLVEITESSFSKLTKGPDEIPINVSETKRIKVGEADNNDGCKVEITENKFSTFELDQPHWKAFSKDLHLHDPIVDTLPKEIKSIEDESPAISLTEIKGDDEEKTYVTEIHVQTPKANSSENIAEVKITSPTLHDPLENAFENYVKNFEKKLETFESNMQNFESNLEEFVRDDPVTPDPEDDRSDVEKQVSKIQEIAEEQLRTLPEMRFTTSSYESSERKAPEKRHSFELLRSNFEKASNDNGNGNSKSPPRRDSNTPTKSRIPIATGMKTPPMSPERRDSRNLENENDRAILELMSSSSPPSFTSKIKPPSASSKNVSVTSIRNNSKTPSGLPTLSGKPPIPPRKSEDNGSQANGGVESSFKQWVFNPGSNVTNVTVGKEK